VSGIGAVQTVATPAGALVVFEGNAPERPGRAIHAVPLRCRP
jgi:hypothetical protein